MAEGDSPTVARRRVRMALREAREAREHTQQQVADAMDWSLSKVIRVENGDVSIAPNDLRSLLAYLGVKGRVRVAELVDAATIARTRRRAAWYQAPAYREHLTDSLRKLIEFEAEATWIANYSVFHVPGAIQIPEYSTALTETWSDELTPDQIKHRVQARKRRHEAILARAGSLRLTALLDESVLRRPVGGSAVVLKQLQEMLRMSGMGLLEVRLIGFDAEVPVSYNAGFDILFLGDEGDLSSAVMYRETGTTDEIIEDVAVRGPGIGPQVPGVVARHYERYQKLWNAADDEADTIAFIERRIRELGLTNQ
jgi:transcriptional regulator with XRE-family HTH domain